MSADQRWQNSRLADREDVRWENLHSTKVLLLLLLLLVQLPHVQEVNLQ